MLRLVNRYRPRETRHNVFPVSVESFLPATSPKSDEAHMKLLDNEANVKTVFALTETNMGKTRKEWFPGLIETGPSS